ncbi:hypothetical protein GC163_12650 [bacterium]|nr:hypothetical protein [bacterium]
MTNALANKTDKQLITLVKRGQEAFFETAFAVWEIDRRKIWKESAKSMADFCDMEFGMSPADVTRYKGAARVLLNLHGFSVLPTNEGQARELVRLRHAEPQKTVWKAVVDSGEPITARLIRETADRLLGKVEEDTQPEPEIVITGIGRLVKVVQMLAKVVVNEDDRDAAVEQLDLIEGELARLRASLTDSVAV